MPSLSLLLRPGIRPVHYRPVGRQPILVRRSVSFYQKFIQDIQNGFRQDRQVQANLKELERKKTELTETPTIQSLLKASVCFFNLPFLTR